MGRDGKREGEMERETEAEMEREGQMERGRVREMERWRERVLPLCSKVDISGNPLFLRRVYSLIIVGAEGEPSSQTSRDQG